MPELLDFTGWSFWAVLGLILIGLEMLIPGAVSVFIGIAALITAGAIYLGWISGFTTILTFFFITGIILLLIVRSWMRRFFPSADFVTETDENKWAKDQPVEVVEPIPSGGVGRVSYRGTTWTARFATNSDEKAEVGETLRIMGQDNICWIVRRGDS